jgi:hypothetical protein
MSVATMKSHGRTIEREHSVPVVTCRLMAMLACLGLIVALVFMLRFVVYEHYYGDGASAHALSRAVDL